MLYLQWALAIDSLEVGQPGSDKSFGMQQRPDGDIEIDEKFWEQDFDIPSCNQCGGVLKPDVRILSYLMGVLLVIFFKKISRISIWHWFIAVGMRSMTAGHIS